MSQIPCATGHNYSSSCMHITISQPWFMNYWKSWPQLTIPRLYLCRCFENDCAMAVLEPTICCGAGQDNTDKKSSGSSKCCHFTSRPLGEYWADRVHVVNGCRPSSSTREKMFWYGYQNPAPHMRRQIPFHMTTPALCKRAEQHKCSLCRATKEWKVLEVFLQGNWTTSNLPVLLVAHEKNGIAVLTMNSNLYRTPGCSLPACYEAPRLCSCFQERYLISLQPPSSTPMSHRSQNTIPRRGFEPAAMGLLSLKRSSAIWLQEPKIRSVEEEEELRLHCEEQRSPTCLVRWWAAPSPAHPAPTTTTFLFLFFCCFFSSSVTVSSSSSAAPASATTNLLASLHGLAFLPLEYFSLPICLLQQLVESTKSFVVASLRLRGPRRSVPDDKRLDVHCVCKHSPAISLSLRFRFLNKL